jgi:hypothetical protein
VVTLRQCDNCGAHMPAYEPRTRVGERMLCDACKANPRGGFVSASVKPWWQQERRAMKKQAQTCGACDGTGEFDGVECGACEGSGDLASSEELRYWDEGVHHYTHDEPAEHIMWNAVAAYDHLKNAHGLSDAEIDRRYQTIKDPENYPFYQGNRGAHNDVHAEHVPQKIPHQHGTSTGPDSMRSSGRRQERRVMNNQANLRKHAHDSGDGETIYHCPFCGSGQVIARSDRTIECEFCHTSFTCQVQPQFSAFPQTINGVPVQVPGMPGQVGEDPMAGADPNDPNAQDPNGGGSIPPQGDDSGDVPDEDRDDSPSGDSSTGGNPFAASLRTSTGRKVSREDYLARLALIASHNRAATLEQIRSRRHS